MYAKMVIDKVKEIELVNDILIISKCVFPHELHIAATEPLSADKLGNFRGFDRRIRTSDRFEYAIPPQDEKFKKILSIFYSPLGKVIDYIFENFRLYIIFEGNVKVRSPDDELCFFYKIANLKTNNIILHSPHMLPNRFQQRTILPMLRVHFKGCIIIFTDNPFIINSTPATLYNIESGGIFKDCSFISAETILTEMLGESMYSINTVTCGNDIKTAYNNVKDKEEAYDLICKIDRIMKETPNIDVTLHCCLLEFKAKLNYKYDFYVFDINSRSGEVSNECASMAVANKYLVPNVDLTGTHYH